MKQQAIFQSTSLVLLLAAVGCAGSAPVASPPSDPAPSAKQEKSAPLKEAKFAPDFQPLEIKEATGSFLPPLPTAVTSFGAAEASGRVYLMGGYHGVPHRYSKEGQSDEIWSLALAGSSAWEKVGTMKTALQGLASVAHGERLCQFGGTHAHNAEGEPMDMRSVATARCFDTKTKEWSELPDLPSARSSHEVALVGDTVFVAGGWNLKGKPGESEWATDLLSLDLSKKDAAWSSAEVPFRVRAAGIAGTKSHVIVAGGLSPQSQPQKKVRFYDVETKAWSDGPDFPADAFGLAVTASGDTFYASGRDGVLRSVKPGDEKWTDVRPLSFGRFFHQLVATQEDVVVLGGIGGMHTRGRTRPVELLPLDAGKTAFGTIKLSHPGLSKNRQGFIWNGEMAYLFGGNNSLGQHDFARKNFLKEGWIVDFATLKASRGPSFPTNRQSMLTLSNDSGGVAIGGFGFAEGDNSQEAQAKTAQDVLVYDWDQFAWKADSKLARGRTQFGLFEHEGTRWIIGGLNYDPARKGPAAFDHVLDIQKAEAGQEFSETSVKLPAQRRAFAAALHQGKYYIIGGMKDGFAIVDDCLVFDVATEKFSPLPCPEGSRLSGELVAAREKLYLLGGSLRGEKGMEENQSVEVFDLETQKWSKLDFEIPMSVRHMRAFPFHDQILLFSTHHEKQELLFATLSPARK